MMLNVLLFWFSAALFCCSVNAADYEPISVLEYVDTAFGLDRYTRAYLHALYEETEASDELQHLLSLQSRFPQFTDDLEANRAELRAYCGGAFDFADISDLEGSFVARASLDEVLGYATLCQNIYSIKQKGDPERLMLVYPFKEYRLVYVLSRNKGTQISGTVLYDKKTRHVVIVFAGANSGVDWAWSTLGPKSTTWYPGLTVHTGAAYQAYLQRPQVYEALDLLDADRPLRVTVAGHGLGGAMSTLIACDIKTRMPDATVENITFGSPRTFGVGSSFKVESFLGLGQVLRVVNERDPMTMYPHPNVFRHVGVPVPLQSQRGRIDHIPAGVAFGATLGLLVGMPKGPVAATKGALKGGGKRVGEYHGMQTYADTLKKQYPAFQELVTRRMELLRLLGEPWDEQSSKEESTEKAKEKHFFPQAFERAQRTNEARRALQAELDPDQTRTSLEAELNRVLNYDDSVVHGYGAEIYSKLLMAAIDSFNE
jgi:hypothetical protein